MNSMSGTWLPLFPLNAVLFPHSSLPLHIFEERYKTLINECLERGTCFGITLSREDGLAGVGCTATIASVLKRYEDGRMDIVVEGIHRYRMIRCDEGKGPYLVAEVEYIVDAEEKIDRHLALDTVQMFNALLAMAYKGDVAPLAADKVVAGLSFLIAQKAGLDLEHRQELLEMERENQRLQTLHRYLEELLPRLRRLEEIERVVKNDGYL